MIPDTVRKYTVFPTLFKGLAGLGNFLLDCYQFTGNTDYVERAFQTAKGIQLYAIGRPEGTAFPGENQYRISTDFGAGCAGIALFFDRLLNNRPNFNFVLDGLLPSAQGSLQI